ncbi:hypothetical protein [Brasilonema sp. UFV-L1]|uniref:hypothetical protein n=1 Tax=Brasilonema sp. UFV-L1 TaxID=2234130 RepID=UPI00145D5661|nr:hypothetical protein [Brasilonema sp. UFV-L1]NMG10007.1 hypothetical protein [Brasilonema sp. UFV-L1]
MTLDFRVVFSQNALKLNSNLINPLFDFLDVNSSPNVYADKFFIIFTVVRHGIFGKKVLRFVLIVYNFYKL